MRSSTRRRSKARFDGGDEKRPICFFSETEISARFEILAIWIAAQWMRFILSCNVNLGEGLNARAHAARWNAALRRLEYG